METKCDDCGHALITFCPSCRGRAGGSKKTPAQLNEMTYFIDREGMLPPLGTDRIRTRVVIEDARAVYGSLRCW